MPTQDQLNKAKKLVKFSQNPNLAAFEEQQTISDSLATIAQKFETTQEMKIMLVKGEKGDKGEPGAEGPTGPKPEAGVDYPIPNDGKDGKDGRDGKDGESPSVEDVVTQVIPLIPEPKDGLPGKDGSSDTAAQIVEKLESLEDDNRLDASAIKNLPEAKHTTIFGGSPDRRIAAYDETTLLTKIVSAIKFAGAGVQATVDKSGVVTVTITGSASSESNGETLTDSGDHTSFTFAHAPSTGGVRNVWRKESGQLLTPTTDYTIAGSTLTATSAQIDGDGNAFTLISNYTY